MKLQEHPMNHKIMCFVELESDDLAEKVCSPEPECQCVLLDLSSR